MAIKRKKDSNKRKQDVTSIIESHQEAIANERRQKDIESKTNLYEVDTVGALSRRQEKRVKVLKKGHSKTTAELERERKWIAAREAALAAEQKKRKLEDSVYDLWGNATTQVSMNNKKRPRIASDPVKQSIPKVIVAAPGQSLNPAQEDWKSFLISLSAKVKKVHEDHELMSQAFEPITVELLHIFPESIVKSLSTSQKLQLFRIAKDSAELLEEPEDFLARVLPTLVDNQEETEKTQESKPTQVEGDRASLHQDSQETKPLGKTRKERNRELRRKAHEAQVAAHAEKKAKRRELERLGEIFSEVQDEETKKEVRKAYRKALEEYWLEANKKGEVKPFRIGKNKFEEPLESFVRQADLEKQQGSMRKVRLPSERTVLRDRLASIQRRGLIELPPLLTGAKYRQMRSRFGRIRNYKRKVVLKQSWKPSA